MIQVEDARTNLRIINH